MEVEVEEEEVRVGKELNLNFVCRDFSLDPVEYFRANV